jgi:hypothetical protein
MAYGIRENQNTEYRIQNTEFRSQNASATLALLRTANGKTPITLSFFRRLRSPHLQIVLELELVLDCLACIDHKF